MPQYKIYGRINKNTALFHIRRTGFFPGLILAVAFASGCSEKKEELNPASIIEFLRCSGGCEVTAVTTDFAAAPVPVALSVFTSSAMEPSISRDDNYLFFNSLNDGVDTSLYCAQRVSDTSFNNVVLVSGEPGTPVNETPPHLDAVASMDTGNNFYWISTRGYPTFFNNVFTGLFSAGSVTGIHRVDGDFYIMQSGWIVMDAEISSDGNDLYFVNAHFSGGAVPDRSDIGVAHRTGSTFTKDVNSAVIMRTINTGCCLEYAPSISVDGLELFFTRLDLRTVSSQILIARRANVGDPFGAPERIGVISGFVEAPSISADGNRLYFHRNDGGTYNIYMVSR